MRTNQKRDELMSRPSLYTFAAVVTGSNPTIVETFLYISENEEAAKLEAFRCLEKKYPNHSYRILPVTRVAEEFISDAYHLIVRQQTD